MKQIDTKLKAPPSEQQIRNRMIYEAIIRKVAQEIWDRPAVSPVTSYRPEQELHPQ